MVHPLNDLKDLKKARAEIGRAKKAAAGAPITRAYFDSTISNLRGEFAAALAPVVAALELGEPEPEEEAEELELEAEERDEREGEDS